MGLLERVAAARTGERRSSIDSWISDFLIPSVDQGSFGYNGRQYPFGLLQTLPGVRAAEVATSLPGYMAALRTCPPAFAAQLVRALVLSQARFTFRNPPSSRTPRRTFGTNELAILERPWPKATTGELLARMEWHAGLTGNAFVARQPTRLRVLRPDWCALIYGSEQEPEDAAQALDGELVGLVYANGGIGGRNEPSTLLPDEFAHWSPIPDPEHAGIGMSWITPAIREIQGDRAMTDHKIRFLANGAAQPYTVGMLTPTGWKRMGDIAVGNLVTGPDGKPRRVIGVYPQGEKDIYRLTFSSGATTECCEDHLWTVANAYDRKLGTTRVMSLRQIIDVGIKNPTGAAKWMIPLVDPVEYADAGPLPLHPYLLGALLGDGTFRSNGKGSGGVSLSAAAGDADETERELLPLLPAGVRITRRDRGGWSELYFKGPGGPITNPLTRTVRDLGLYDVLGRNKAIPEVYMRASVTDRIALLQGLIDTDGSINAGLAGARFDSTSAKLAEQVRELVQSLGGMASCKPAGARVGQPDRRPQWRVYLSRLPEWIIPVRLARKRAAWHPTGRSGRYLYLQRVELIDRRPAQCIKVDADDGLYVTDDFIVTHNTPNLVISGIPAGTQEQFNEIVDKLEERHTGLANAYRTLYLTAGVDASVVGSNLQQLDVKSTQGAGETRISALSRVPASLLGISEGLAGSSLNAGNFAAARRTFADTWVYPTLQDLAAALAPLVRVPNDAELWFEVGDVPLLREDAKDAADIEFVKAQTIRALVDGGFDPASVVAAVQGQDIGRLTHLGLTSVQLVPPGGPEGAPVDQQAARAIVEMVQKVYLGVGVVLSAEEARELLNQAGANLSGDPPPPAAMPAPIGAPA